jgi:hypothetical protein
MKRVTSSELLAEIGHYRNVLEQNGIRCMIKNEQLSGALGEVPVFECLPELWVLNDDDLDRAEKLIRELRFDGPKGTPWVCPNCSEENDAQFAACWNCGKPANRDQEEN